MKSNKSNKPNSDAVSIKHEILDFDELKTILGGDSGSNNEDPPPDPDPDPETPTDPN